MLLGRVGLSSDARMESRLGGHKFAGELLGSFMKCRKQASEVTLADQEDVERKWALEGGLIGRDSLGDGSFLPSNCDASNSCH